jgi:NAD(P)-dependent dehydrogenase (short-subunit alcohol dehydrogenase family)
VETKGIKVLITGANRGIGRAVAKRLAEDGVRLFLAIRNQDQALVEEMKKAGAASVHQQTVCKN